MEELPLKKAMNFPNKIRHTKLLIKISTIVDLIFCDWCRIIKVVSIISPCESNVSLIITYQSVAISHVKVMLIQSQLVTLII